MNLKSINKWLDEEYGCSYTRLEELHDSYFEKYCDLEQENKQLKEELECTIGIVEHNRIISEKNKEIHQLKDNWNKLKEFLKNTRKENLEWDKKHNCEWQGYNAYYELLIKMQKLEQGSDSNVKD